MLIIIKDEHYSLKLNKCKYSGVDREKFSGLEGENLLWSTGYELQEGILLLRHPVPQPSSQGLTEGGHILVHCLDTSWYLAYISLLPDLIPCFLSSFELSAASACRKDPCICLQVSGYNFLHYFLRHPFVTVFLHLRPSQWTGKRHGIIGIGHWKELLRLQWSCS